MSPRALSANFSTLLTNRFNVAEIEALKKDLERMSIAEEKCQNELWVRSEGESWESGGGAASAGRR